MNDDGRELLEPVEGDRPSPEFVEDLWDRLDDAWTTRDTPTRTDPSPTAIDVVVHDEGNMQMGRNRLGTIIAAAAAIVVVIVGFVVITNDDDDTSEIGPADVPETDGGGAADETTTTTSPTTTTTEPAPDRSFDIAYVEVGSAGSVAASAEFAWVAQADPPTLTTIDLATNTVVTEVEIPPDPRFVTHGFDSVWIVHLDGTLSRYDPAAETIVASIEIGTAGWPEPGEDAVWMSSGTEAVRIDPETNAVTTRIEVGPGIGVVAESGGSVWTRDALGAVHRIDLATETVIATIPTEAGGPFMAGDEGVWAVGSDAGAIYRIDLETNEVVATVTIVDEGTGRVRGFHMGGGSVWVRFEADCDSGQCRTAIARIDSETNEVVATTDLREGWQPTGGMNAGPTTVWTFNPDAVARVDF